jgi:hypothetical protein
VLYLLYREKFDKVADFTGQTESLRTDAAWQEGVHEGWVEPSTEAGLALWVSCVLKAARESKEERTSRKAIDLLQFIVLYMCV